MKSIFKYLLAPFTAFMMIMAGCSADEIRARWQDDVEQFKQQRRKYLLYEE